MKAAPIHFVLAVALAAGCARTTTRRAETAPERTTTVREPIAAASACPMDLSGVTLAVEDTVRGASLVFLTTEDANVIELRDRVRAMARMHERRAVRGEDRPRPMMMPPSRVTAEDVPGGAKLTFEPLDAGDLAALRLHVQQMAERERGMGMGMHDGGEGCPMMQMMMHGGPPPARP